MLGNVEMRSVIALVGDKELDTGARHRAMDHFKIPYPEGEQGFVVGILNNPLVRLMREYEFLLCNVADWKNPNWGHAVVIWDGHLYDPWRGIDPNWPWTRHVWKAVPIGPKIERPA